MTKEIIKKILINFDRDTNSLPKSKGVYNYYAKLYEEALQRERLNEETTKYINHNLSIGLTPKDWYDENKK